MLFILLNFLTVKYDSPCGAVVASSFFFFLSTDGVYKIMKYLIHPFLINKQSICQNLSVVDSFDCRHLCLLYSLNN